MRRPVVAVLSGKGGTGKTAIAVSLALSLPRAHLLDADVEEPDAALFLDLRIDRREAVAAPVPHLEKERCDACATRARPVCAEVCAYGAVAVAGGEVLLFPERCNGCGACIDLCPRAALREGEKTVGTIEEGRAGDLLFTRATLRVGEPRVGDLVRALRRRARPDRLVVIDGPPGAGVAAAEAVRGVDAAILVAEPTPFGRRDLARAIALCRRFDVPAGVVLNRAGSGDGGVAKVCAREGVPVLLRIPFSRRVAEAGAHGVPLVAAEPERREEIEALVDERLLPSARGAAQ